MHHNKNIRDHSHISVRLPSDCGEYRQAAGVADKAHAKKKRPSMTASKGGSPPLPVADDQMLSRVAWALWVNQLQCAWIIRAVAVLPL